MNLKVPFEEEYDGVPEGPQCNSCKHFEGYGFCAAFPDGIPLEIISNDLIHDEELEGQEGDYIYTSIDKKH